MATAKTKGSSPKVLTKRGLAPLTLNRAVPTLTFEEAEAAARGGDYLAFIALRDSDGLFRAGNYGIDFDGVDMVIGLGNGDSLGIDPEFLTGLGDHYGAIVRMADVEAALLQGRQAAMYTDLDSLKSDELAARIRAAKDEIEVGRSILKRRFSDLV